MSCVKSNNYLPISPLDTAAFRAPSHVIHLSPIVSLHLCACLGQLFSHSCSPKLFFESMLLFRPYRHVGITLGRSSSFPCSFLVNHYSFHLSPRILSHPSHTSISIGISRRLLHRGRQHYCLFLTFSLEFRPSSLFGPIHKPLYSPGSFSIGVIGIHCTIFHLSIFRQCPFVFYAALKP